MEKQKRQKDRCRRHWRSAGSTQIQPAVVAAVVHHTKGADEAGYKHQEPKSALVVAAADQMPPGTRRSKRRVPIQWMNIVGRGGNSSRTTSCSYHYLRLAHRWRLWKGEGTWANEDC